MAFWMQWVVKMLPFPHEQGRSLSTLTTFGIGGPARFFARCLRIEQMQEMLRAASALQIPFLVIGKGSNCLFDDRGFAGLVIQNRIDSLHQEGGRFVVGAGYGFARLGLLSAKQGWSGLEFAAGIPATVGGALFMNAGAGGQEVKDVVSELLFVSKEGELQRFSREQCAFGYRHSVFHDLLGAIVEGTFLLEAKGEAKGKQEEQLSKRLATQPYKERSAGCAFRNPPEGAAGRWIESCGLKGLQIGGAQVSSVHANFIVNRGGATASDVRALMELVKGRVFEKTGVVLQEEIRCIPYEPLV